MSRNAAGGHLSASQIRVAPVRFVLTRDTTADMSTFGKMTRIVTSKILAFGDRSVSCMTHFKVLNPPYRVYRIHLTCRLEQERQRGRRRRLRGCRCRGSGSASGFGFGFVPKTFAFVCFGAGDVGSGCTRVGKIAEWQRIMNIKIQSLKCYMFKL